MIRFLKFLLGIILIPVAIGTSVTFYESLQAIGYFSFNLHLFLWGIFLYMAIHLIFYEPNYIYTLGHEIIHVIATWICGGKVTSFHVSSQGGSVATTKDNFFINISPYLIPFYTVLLVVIYPLIRRFIDAPFKDNVFTFLLGFTLALHIIMTVRTLKIKQPDLVKAGIFFSIILIYVINLVVVFSILSLILDTSGLKAFFREAFITSKGIYSAVFNRFYYLTLR